MAPQTPPILMPEPKLAVRSAAIWLLSPFSSQKAISTACAQL